MPNPKQKKLLQFLENSGALGSGDPERIKAAKRAYRREYMRAYKRRYRAEHGEVRITLNAEERGTIDRAAHHHKLERPSFIKQATLAYIGRKYIVPDRQIVAKAELGIASIASELRTLARTQTSGLLDRAINYRKLSERVDRLETVVREMLHHPKELEELLQGKGIDDPALTERIKRVLEQ